MARSSAHKNYCYWSVAVGEKQTQVMQACVMSAREVGVFRPIHVMSDRPLEACDCYDAMEIQQGLGLFQLIYLKAAMPRLPHDYFIWLSPTSSFHFAPEAPLFAMGSSPIHVPLFERATAISESDCELEENEKRRRELMRRMGIMGVPFFGSALFWMVHRDVIDLVVDLAMSYWKRAKEDGLVVEVGDSLAYAMQILCGDPRRHLVERHLDLWALEEAGNEFGKKANPVTAIRSLPTAFPGEIPEVRLPTGFAYPTQLA